MAYKDKDKQREANKKASQRRRDKAKGMTQGMTNEGMTAVNEQTHVIPCSNSGTSVIPKQSSTDTLGTEAESLQHKSGTDTMSVKCITIDDQAKSMKTMAMLHGKPKPQSHNSMMVGYVPPKN